jgi:hypothetical protein
MKAKYMVAVVMVGATVLASGCSKQSKSVSTEPEVSDCPVHSGMTIKQVVAELGPADPTNAYGGGLGYSRFGLLVAPNNAGVVHSVTFMQPFSGRTKQGIGIGSSRAEVIQAYGEPTAVRQGRAGDEFLRYSSPALVFQIHDGKVDLMSVNFETTK